MRKEKEILPLINEDYFIEIGKHADEIQQKVFVIGGFVRDLLLKRQNAKDIDIVIEGDGIALAKKVQEKLPKASKVQVFKNYGTAMFHYREIQLEFVGARKESYSLESRNPEVEKGTIKDDQNRRDFTINALAISLNKNTFGKLIDPFEGVKDLQNKIIRTPLDPTITYSDDPLRMMRAIRFATQLNFTIEEKSLAAISSQKERIEIISKERIVEELNKILSTQKPSIGFLLLEETGLLGSILPELTALKGVEEVDNQTHKDNFYHTLEVVDNIAPHTEDIWLRWAALLHDVGKATTKKFDKNNGWTFHSHEYVGAKMVYQIFKRLKMPLNQKMKYVQKLVFMSSRPISLVEEHVTDSAIRRFILDSGEEMEDLFTLCHADITTKNPTRFEKYHNNFKIVKQKIKEVEARDKIRNFQPPITGNIILETFDIKPSKEIAQIKEAIKEAILEGEIPNDFDAAHAMMLELGKKLGLQLKK